ncbi:hypothetical protein [Bacteroides sp.]
MSLWTGGAAQVGMNKIRIQKDENMKTIHLFTFCLVWATIFFTGCGEDSIFIAQPEIAFTGTYELPAGEPLSTLPLNGTATYEGQAVAGTLAWKDGTTTYDKAGEYEAAWAFTPQNSDIYQLTEGTVPITVSVNGVTVQITGTYELPAGEPLSTLTLIGTAHSKGQAVAGTLTWKDGTTTYDKAGEYEAAWVFTPQNSDIYQLTEGTVPVTVSVNGVAVQITGTYKLYVDEPLSTLTLIGTAHSKGQAVEGTLAWKDGTTTYDKAGEYEAAWVFTPRNADIYETVEGTTRITTACIDIYTCGYEMEGNRNIGKVWKNGQVLYTLSDGSNNSYSYSLVVWNGDIYTCGSDGTISKVWKNGQVLYTLSDGSNNSYSYSLVVWNGDIYTCGYDGTIGKVWKNGQVLYTLSDGSNKSMARSLAVWNGDVYTCGYEIEGNRTIGKVWKNGQVLYTLSDGSKNSYSYSLAVWNGKVYTCGYDGKTGKQIGKVWQNDQVLYTQGDGTSYDIVYSLAVWNGDVYTCGSDGKTGKVWQNDQILYTLLPNDETRVTVAFSLAVWNGKVYTCGQEVNRSNRVVGTVRLNGEVLYMTDGSKNTVFQSIVIVGRTTNIRR